MAVCMETVLQQHSTGLQEPQCGGWRCKDWGFPRDRNRRIISLNYIKLGQDFEKSLKTGSCYTASQAGL